MSRAFVKEDVDPPERSGRVRSASGLPPGATNYITSSGAARLRRELAQLRQENAEKERISELEETLASVTIVQPPDESGGESVSFGARVTVANSAGELTSYRIVGVNELDFYSDAVSWVSPTGRVLLAAELGDRVSLGDGVSGKVVKIEFPAE